MPANPSDRRTRLLIVVTHPLTALNLMRGQLRFLNANGFEVAVASGRGPALEEVAKAEGVRTFGVPLERELRPLRDLRALIALIRVIRKFAPDIVSASTPKAGLLGMLAARIAGVRHRLLTIRGLRLETVRGLRRRMLIAGRRLAARCAHQVLCVSPSLRDLYLELELAPPDHTRVLGGGTSNGIEVARFARLGGERSAALRADLGLPEGAHVVGFVGRLTRDKGLEDLVVALREIWRHSPRTHLLLIGDFEGGDPISPATVDALTHEPRVARTGWVSDSAPFYSVMDVVAFPSYREGFPNVPLEAAAAGLPVVAYAATGTVDAVVDGSTGTLTPVGDTGALAAGILRYLETPPLRAAHGKAGRQRVERCFQSERVWRDWLGEYERLTRK